VSHSTQPCLTDQGNEFEKHVWPVCPLDLRVELVGLTLALGNDPQRLGMPQNHSVGQRRHQFHGH
jgi:hypothetical protein